MTKSGRLLLQPALQFTLGRDDVLDGVEDLKAPDAQIDLTLAARDNLASGLTAFSCLATHETTMKSTTWGLTCGCCWAVETPKVMQSIPERPCRWAE